MDEDEAKTSFPYAKEHGHLWPFHCEKHGGHGGCCASCLKESKIRRDREYKERLREEVEVLRAENKELKSREPCIDNCPFKTFKDA